VQHSRRTRWLAILSCAATACLDPLPDGASGPISARVDIVPKAADLQIGDTFQFQLRVTSYGPALTSDNPRWTLSDTTIAQVDTTTGRVVGKRTGSATVSASAAGAGATAQLVVSPAILVGAGDIASCTSTGDEATAALLDAVSGTVFTAGDNAYDSGTYDQYSNCYDPSWGRHRARTRPSPGNHEYLTPGATGYFQYFGPSAGDPSKGYYSYDLGSWHIVAINSNVDVRPGSKQEQWLRADLAAHPAHCTLAYWHYPRFSSGYEGNHLEMQAIWQALYDAGAEVVISGHDHDYERFAPQTPSGAPDPVGGIREFVVGTGGKSLLAFHSTPPNSEVRDKSTFGVLLLRLYDDRYEWEFMPTQVGGFTDAGADTCH